jgi:hypothetical protein
MKGNTKKLAVLVIIIAMAPFIMAAMASADDHERRTIHGKYEFTGSNACLTAFAGFDELLQPKPIPGAPPGTPASAPIDAQSWEGVYRFKHNGTGVLDAVAHDVGISPPGGGGGSVSIHWDFTYTVNPGGKITFTLVPGSYVAEWLTGTLKGQKAGHDFSDSWHGVISPDGNHILVTWGAPVILDLLEEQGGKPTGVQLICNGAFSSFRVH